MRVFELKLYDFLQLSTTAQQHAFSEYVKGVSTDYIDEDESLTEEQKTEEKAYIKTVSGFIEECDNSKYEFNEFGKQIYVDELTSKD